jgi:hypothetical protein
MTDWKAARSVCRDIAADMAKDAHDFELLDALTRKEQPSALVEIAKELRR